MYLNLLADEPAAVMQGLGAALPRLNVTNEDLSRRLETSDHWIRTRTGISNRRVAAPNEATSDFACEAGMRALVSAGGPEIDLLILATTTPDRRCPATAPLVAQRLGLGNIPAFDISAVCSGFVYALSVAEWAITARRHRSVLVIGAETFTSILNPGDRATSVIFGDGAGAMVLRSGELDEPGSILATALYSDGSLADLITIPSGGSRRAAEKVHDPATGYFTMMGREVFTAAVGSMASSGQEVLKHSGWTSGEVDWLVAHQANLRILHAVADELDIPREKALVHLDRVGNTSAASIPLALAAHADRFHEKDKILLTAFGGGSTWGSVTLTWADVTVTDPH